MRKSMLIAAVLVAGTIGAIAEQAAAEEMKVTGKVTEANQDAKQITVAEKTLDMSDQAGTSMFPQVGAEVTVFYEERDGKNVVTRIGQAQQ